MAAPAEDRPAEDRPAEFAAVAARLRAILEPYRGPLVVTKDGPLVYALEIPGLEGKPWGYIAGIRVGKSYVSYYLMAAYVWPAVAKSLSPELRRRMQGKACFNFKKIDESLFAELADVTARGIERWRTEGWPAPAR